MLTLEPPFRGKDRHELIHQVIDGEARPPRHLNPSIPRDLETVVLKAMATEPGVRFATAQEMADDLRRFLECRPVLARRPSFLDRVSKWSRRHLAIVWAALLFVTLSAICLVVSTILIAGAHRGQTAAYEAEKSQRQIATDLQAQAERRETVLRHHLYAADLKLAHQAWENADLGWAIELLSRHRPELGQTDLRGFEWRYLWTLCHKDLRTLRGHEGNIYCVAFSPDGLTLATAGEDATVKLWDVATGGLQRTITGHSSEVNHVVFSPDGATLATVSDGGEVMLWDAATGSPKGTLDGHTEDVFAVAFSPDGRRLATGGRDDTAKLWDAATLEEQATLSGHSNDVESLAFSPDGKTLATASSDRSVKLWDVPSGKERTSWQAHDDWVTSIAYSHDGSKLATASKDLTIKVWNAAAGKLLWSASAHKERIHCVTFSPDDRVVASTGMDGMVRLWEADSGESGHVIRGHVGRVWWGAFSPDGRLLATAGADGTARLWDPDVSQEYVPAISGRGDVHAIGFARNSEMLTYLTHEGELRFLDLKTGREDSFTPAPGASTCFLAVSADGHTVATCGGHGYLRGFDAVAARELPWRIGPHPGGIWDMVFALDDRTLATVGEAASVRFWDVDAGRQRAAWQAGSEEISSLAIAPDGRTVATGSGDGTIGLWNAETGSPRANLAAHDGTVTAIVFSPDGSTMASAGADRKIKLWDPGSGREKATLMGHADCVRDIAFSADGKTLASASDDRTVRLWSIFSAQELLRLEGHGLPISSLASSQDGRLLASHCSSSLDGDCEVFLWPADTDLKIGD